MGNRRKAGLFFLWLGAISVAAVLIAFGTGVVLWPRERPASTVSAAEELTPTTTPPQPEVVKVAAFLPNRISFDKVSVDGTSENLLSLAMDPDPAQVLTVKLVNGRGLLMNASGREGPRIDMPGVVEWQNGKDTFARSWPGTDLGTVQVAGHTQRGSDMQFTPLLALFQPGTEQYADGSYRVTLSGVDGQSLTYAIREVVVINKGDRQKMKDLQLNENIPNRFIGYYCYETKVSDTWVIADLVPSLSVSSHS
ncbi:hypothetical protein KDA14_04710 [Candidatus Saccharibacteria bacterium]|nr:hypothetical protein [Candidatus Saccharibacteria bacterium]